MSLSPGSSDLRDPPKVLAVLSLGESQDCHLPPNLQILLGGEREAALRRNR